MKLTLLHTHKEEKHGKMITPVILRQQSLKSHCAIGMFCVAFCVLEKKTGTRVSLWVTKGQQQKLFLSVKCSSCYVFGLFSSI